MKSETLVASVSLQFLSIGTRVNIFITSYYIRQRVVPRITADRNYLTTKSRGTTALGR